MFAYNSTPIDYHYVGHLIGDLLDETFGERGRDAQPHLGVRGNPVVPDREFVPQIVLDRLYDPLPAVNPSRLGGPPIRLFKRLAVA